MYWIIKQVLLENTIQGGEINGKIVATLSDFVFII